MEVIALIVDSVYICRLSSQGLKSVTALMFNRRDFTEFLLGFYTPFVFRLPCLMCLSLVSKINLFFHILC